MIDSVNLIARIWWDWMWAMTWQVSLLIVFIAAVDRVIRKWAWPQLRYGLWLMVVVKLLLPPTFYLPTSITAQILPAAIRQEAEVVNPGISTAVPAAQMPSATRPPSANGGSALSLPEAVSLQDSRTSKSVRFSGLACAMIVWFACASSLVVYLGVRLHRLRRVSFSCSADDLPDWLRQLLADVSLRLSLQRPPDVVVSERTASPGFLAYFGRRCYCLGTISIVFRRQEQSISSCTS